MNEASDHVKVSPAKSDPKALTSAIGRVANIQVVPVSDPNERVQRFAGRTISSKSIVLISMNHVDDSKSKITVNCEKMVIGSMLTKDIKKALSS